MSSDETARRASAVVTGLAADLALIAELEKIKVELETMDNKCAFYENVYGRDHDEYRKVHGERDAVLLRADALVQRWIEDRQHVPAPRA